MNTQEREHIGRLIRRFAAKAATDDLLILIAETSGMFEACSRLVREAASGDRAIVDWLRQQCQAARVRPAAFLAEIEAICTTFRPGAAHGDLYAELELEPGASREAIKRSYRRLCRRYHPDTGGGNRDDAAFMRITNAYHQLVHGEAQAPASTAARREGSHWRRSLVPDTTEARRAQKRKNVVVVALLALVLVFVSLLAARTYNSRVMMTGLKNKSLAFVPPTTTPSAPDTTTTAAAPSPPPPNEHAAEAGCAARTDCTPPTPTTASTAAQPPRKERTTTAAAPPSPPPPDEHAAEVGCAARTNCEPSTPTNASTEAQPPPKDSPSAPQSAAGQVASTRKVETPATDPAPPMEKPAVHLIPGKKKKVAPPATVAAQHQIAASPVPAMAATSPAVGQSDAAPAKATPEHASRTQTTPTAPAPAAPNLASSTEPQPIAAATTPTPPAPVAAKKTLADEHAAQPTVASTQPPPAEHAAKPTIAAAQPPPAEHAANVGCAARTDCTPPATTTAQQPTTGQANKKTASSTQSTTSPNEQTAHTASTSRTTGTTTQKAKPEAATPAALAATTQPSPKPPTQPQPRERIDAFLHAYTAAYEQKNLPTFARFFAANATENGKTLNEVLSAYRELFTTAETLRFTVSPTQYEHNQGHLHLRGRFTIAMTFKDEVTRSGQGEITFRLTDTTPPQVQTLRYTFDQ